MNLYKDGEGDARQTTRDHLTAAEVLFRPRYRKLDEAEVDLHDRIKAQASVMAALFYEVAPIHAGPTRDRERGANVQLAIRNLEDAVYRAVKALTGPVAEQDHAKPLGELADAKAAGGGAGFAQLKKEYGSDESVATAAAAGRGEESDDRREPVIPEKQGEVDDLAGRLQRGEPISPEREGEVEIVVSFAGGAPKPLLTDAEAETLRALQAKAAAAVSDADARDVLHVASAAGRGEESDVRDPPPAADPGVAVVQPGGAGAPDPAAAQEA